MRWHRISRTTRVRTSVCTSVCTWPFTFSVSHPYNNDMKPSGYDPWGLPRSSMSSRITLSSMSPVRNPQRPPSTPLLDPPSWETSNKDINIKFSGYLPWGKKTSFIYSTLLYSTLLYYNSWLSNSITFLLIWPNYILRFLASTLLHRGGALDLAISLTHLLTDSQENLLRLSESTFMTTKWHQVSQMVQNNSRIVPKDSQMVQNDSLYVPNDSKMVQNDSQTDPNYSQMVPNDSRIVTNDSQMLPNDSQSVPNDFKMVPNDSQMVPNDSQRL